MNIMPVSLNLMPKTTAYPAFGTKNKLYNTKAGNEQDTFIKRDDKYTKTYRALIKKAAAAQKDNERFQLGAGDVRFLLDIKDYDKFRTVISTPIEEKTWRGTDRLNIFFFADAQAASKLAARLKQNGDKKILLNLLMQKRGNSGRNVFHDIAEQDDINKANALKSNLSVKEFRRFMKSKDDFHISPYSIAQDKNNRVKALAEPLFADDFFEY